MPIFEVITDRKIYWAHTIGKMKTFEVANDLNFYTTAEFMRLAALKCGKGGEKHFQLAQEVMKFFFLKDEPSLTITNTAEFGDPFTTIKATYYLDQNTKNTWTVEFCQGSGIHGVTGMFYTYKSNGFEFRSNPTMKLIEEY